MKKASKNNKTKKIKNSDKRWVVENRDEGWTWTAPQVFMDLGDAMDHIDTLKRNAVPTDNIALYEAVRISF